MIGVEWGYVGYILGIVFGSASTYFIMKVGQ